MIGEEIQWERHGKTYSQFNPKGEVNPTHPLLKIAGTGQAVWNPENERWVV